MTTFQQDSRSEERVITPPDEPRDGKTGRGGTGAANRARQLLTFRLDLEFRQRLRARLAREGRSLSEVVVHGLQQYLQQSSLSGEAARGLDAAGAGETVRSPDEPGAGQATPGLDEPGAPERDTAPARSAAGPVEIPHPNETPDPARAPGSAEAAGAARAPGPAKAPGPVGTAVASVADLVLPDEVARLLRDLRGSGQSELLSATLAALHDRGWPLRPLAAALGISRQAVLARVRQLVPADIRSRVPAVPPPAPFPRRRSARPEGRRPHLTVKIDQALRAAAHLKAQREGRSLTQVIERILDHYLHHGLPHGGLPHGEIRLGDTTPTRPAARRRRRSPAKPGEEA
jgi:predicted HicB family RNase H-like nuclease